MCAPEPRPYSEKLPLPDGDKLEGTARKAEEMKELELWNKMINTIESAARAGYRKAVISGIDFYKQWIPTLESKGYYVVVRTNVEIYFPKCSKNA